MFCQCGTYLSKTACAQQVELQPAKSEAPPFRVYESHNFEFKFVQKEHREKLVEAHELGSRILRHEGYKPEPFETALVVEEHRWFWKPKEVKFILVAESHVYTGKEEVNVKIDSQKLHEFVPNFPVGAPTNFVKLVYCLGYGRPEILDYPERIEFNPGTKQYTELFAKCIGSEDSSTRGSLRWKTKLLKEVKHRGLWLLDASCHACALGRKERLPNNIVKRIVPISWRTYVQPIIEDLAIDPERVWIIGGSLQSLLRGKYSSSYNWSYQPNAILGGPNKEKLQQEKRRRNLLLEKTAKQFLS